LRPVDIGLDDFRISGLGLGGRGLRLVLATNGLEYISGGIQTTEENCCLYLTLTLTLTFSLLN